MRLDKWLWAARFFKTRGLAQAAIAAGRVKLHEERTKPAHSLKVGDLLEIEDLKIVPDDAIVIVNVDGVADD